MGGGAQEEETRQAALTPLASINQSAVHAAVHAASVRCSREALLSLLLCHDPGDSAAPSTCCLPWSGHGWQASIPAQPTRPCPRSRSGAYRQQHVGTI